MKRLLAVLAFIALPSLAWAQGAIVQSGAVTPRDFACFLANGVAYDCGISSLAPVVLPATPTANLLGNATASPIAAQVTPLTSLLDSMCTGIVQGQVLYRAAGLWTCLPVGTTGQFLQTQGATANPVWADATGTTYTAGTGLTLTSTVFSLTAPVTVDTGGTGLTAGVSGGIPAYTGTTTIASSALLAQHGLMLGGGAAAVPYTMGSRGTTGQVLTSAGASADPTWSAAPTGTVTSVATSSGITGGTITGTGTISCVAAASGVKGCPTPDTNAAHYLAGDGTWTVPAGAASVVLRGATSAIGGGSLAAGACASGTATVTGATTSMAASASPVAAAQPDSTHGLAISAYVSASNTVTVEVCAIVASTTPNSVVYQVAVNP